MPDATPVFFSDLITTPCQVWSRWTYIHIAVLYCFCCRYITLRYGLDFWPLTLNICSVSLVTWRDSVPNLNVVKYKAIEYRPVA